MRWARCRRLFKGGRAASPPALLNLPALAATLMSTNDGEGGASTPRTSALDNFSLPSPNIGGKNKNPGPLSLLSPFPNLAPLNFIFLLLLFLPASVNKRLQTSKSARGGGGGGGVGGGGRDLSQLLSKDKS